jgi:hypothetical protein
MRLLLLAAALLAAPPPPASDLTLAVSELLGIAYVDDAALDEKGRWTFFARPETTAKTPGLNCSGLVVAAAQRLLGKRISLVEATRDRLGDSGDGAPLGKDWDFGWDLVMNLSDGLPRRALLPEGELDLAGASGASARGFSLDDERGWKKVLARLACSRVYLASISREGQRLSHFHVAFLLKDPQGRSWFYQTLPKGRSHRLELSSTRGFERMQAMFGKGLRVLVLEVEPPR